MLLGTLVGIVHVTLQPILITQRLVSGDPWHTSRSSEVYTKAFLDHIRKIRKTFHHPRIGRRVRVGKRDRESFSFQLFELIRQGWRGDVTL